MNTTFGDRYRAGDSMIHRLDPRIKLMVTILLIVGIVLTPDGAWLAYLLLWILLGTLAVVGQLGAGRLARMAGLALPFTLAAATLPFTTPGRPLLTFAGVMITDTGFVRFLGIVLKCWLAVQAALLLSITTPFTDLLWGLESFHLPGTLIAIIGFMYRYLFTIQDEAQRLLRARAARSGQIKGHRTGQRFRWRVQMVGGMIGSLFLRSYERSERVYMAMLSRGYTGQMKRHTVPSLTWKAIILGAVPVIAVMVIEVAARLI